MAEIVINTNKYLRNADVRKETIAKSIVASFSLEGIKISFEEALRMVNEQYLMLKKQKNNLFH